VRDEIGGEGFADVTAADEAFEAAEDAYARKSWDASASAYARATEQLKQIRAANQWRRAALRLEGEAKAARDEAAASGAERSAPIEFSQAEVFFASGKRLLEAGDGEAAEAEYQRARDEYTASHKRAIEKLREATLLGTNVRASYEALVQGRSCEALEGDGAETECLRAEELLVKGDAAVAALDAATASSSFRSGGQAVKRAQVATELWDVTRPRPPELIRRQPQRVAIRSGPGQVHSFAVEARDPNGDVLSYAWTIDGDAQGETGPTMRRSLESDVTVTVRVSDGNGGTLTEAWQVEIKEQDGAFE
jgi:hypothetical protein